MRSRAAFIAVLLSLISIGLNAQIAITVKSYPFGAPFEFRTSWNEVEGPKPGPFKLTFINNSQAVVLDRWSSTWQFLDKERGWNVFNTFTTDYGSAFITRGRKYFVLGVNYLGGSEGNGADFSVFQRNGVVDKPVYDISYYPSSKKESFSGAPGVFSTGEMIFSYAPEKKLLSWELQKDGKTLFRNPAATEAWMKQGNGEALGYSFKFDYHFFGGNAFSTFPASNIPYGLSGFDFSKGKDLGLTENSPLDYFDKDRKGLQYFYVIGPKILGTDNNRPAINQPGMQLIFGIADPWTKKFIFRALPSGAWNPPRTEAKGLLGLYSRAVDPDGNIYFFDADVNRKVYELKRVANNWWAELGVDKRTVGVVTDNRVRIREKPNTSSSIVGYVYENEYAWVLEQSKETETIGGSTAPWIKVRMTDGREGWVFGAFLDIQ